MLTLDVFDAPGIDSVIVDLREYGGNETNCLNGELWTCELTIPDGMTPGVRLLTVRLIDELGASILVTETQTSGQHFQPSSDDIDLAVTVQNTPPTLALAITEPLQRGATNTEQAIEIQVDDADGILLVRADLGVLKPLGQSNRWVTLYDNGQGLDRVANDGIYTATASIRTSTPISAHEIFVQASDSFGDATSPTSFVVNVAEPDDGETKENEDEFSVTIIAIVAGVASLLAGMVVFFRQRQPPKEGQDRFGFQ